jgi:hypothetical protein
LRTAKPCPPTENPASTFQIQGKLLSTRAQAGVRAETNPSRDRVIEKLRGDC